MKRFAALLSAAALTLSLAACAPAAPGGGTTAQTTPPTAPPTDGPAEVYDLRVGQMGTGIKAAMVVLAHEMGYYREEGLNVTLEQIGSLNDGLTAITLGKLDVLPFGVIPTLTFMAQGSDLAIIGGTIAEGSACVALPEREAEFQDLTGFAGKTVACVRAETGHMIMKEQLRQAGVSLDTVTFVELDGFQSVVEAVAKGSADVGFVNSGFEQNAVTQGLVVPFFVGDYAPGAVCCRQTALRSAVEQNREAYVRFEIANLRAMKLMYDDPEQTIATLAAFSGQSEDYVRYCIYEGCMEISMDPAKNRVAEFYAVMGANGDLPAGAPEDISGQVDSTIYYDALQTMLERYPGDANFQALMDAYSGNNT